MAIPFPGSIGVLGAVAGVSGGLLTVRFPSGNTILISGNQAFRAAGGSTIIFRSSNATTETYTCVDDNEQALYLELIAEAVGHGFSFIDLPSTAGPPADADITLTPNAGSVIGGFQVVVTTPVTTPLTKVFKPNCQVRLGGIVCPTRYVNANLLLVTATPSDNAVAVDFVYEDATVMVLKALGFAYT